MAEFQSNNRGFVLNLVFEKTFLTGDEKEIKEISLWRQKEYCQLATP